MVSGGYRPTAPQNNTGVSGVGGAGSKDGQPNRYISGGKYGEGKAMMQQQQGASMAQAPSATGGAARPAPQIPSLGSLTDGVDDGLPMTAGVDAGPGPGRDALPKSFAGIANTRPDENAAIVKNYLPDLALAARSNNAPDSFKRFVNFLMEQ
jgi:hypothetical protein